MNGSSCAHGLVLETWNTPLQRRQRSRPASLRDGRTKRWPLRSGFALARTEGQCVTRPKLKRWAAKPRHWVELIAHPFSLEDALLWDAILYVDRGKPETALHRLVAAETLVADQRLGFIVER